MLAADLVRNGVDLTVRNGPVDTDLLYLNVTLNRIGVNKTPTADIDVNGTSKIPDLDVVNQAIWDNIIVNADGSMSSTTGPVIFRPNQNVSPYITIGRIIAGNVEVNDNSLRNLSTNNNLELEASGTGVVDILNNTNVQGDLSVTGNINITGNLSYLGNIIIGNDVFVADGINDDTITINTDFTQSILPGDDNLYDFGKFNKRWAELYVEDFSSSSSGLQVAQFIGISSQIAINGNTSTISTLQSNDDLILNPSTGTTILERISINGGDISNLDDPPITFSHTSTGYLRIVGTNGMLIPSGTISERPYTPEVGTTRWNSELDYMECFDGSIWIVATGPGATITEENMNTLGHIYTLILG
jgi:hypothetical protein